MADAAVEAVVLPDSDDDFGLPAIPEADESEDIAEQQGEPPVVVVNVPPARNVRLPARLLRIIEYALPINPPYPQNAREVYAEIDKDMVDSNDPIMRSFKRFLIRKGIYQQHFGEQSMSDSDASGDSEDEDDEEDEDDDGDEAGSEDNEDEEVNGEDEAHEAESDAEPVADAPAPDNDANEPSDADQSSTRKRSGTDATESNPLLKKMKLQNLAENQLEAEAEVEEEAPEQAEEVFVAIVVAPIEEENADTDDESVTTDSSDSSSDSSDSSDSSSESDSD
uniref:Nucleolin-like n=1 Tax=Panagrellus redivivus TaxID=6233 RepID=A0A7E4VZ05_PANRE